MEHPITQRVSEERMHPSYREKEGAFREKAAKLWKEEEEALRDHLRAAADLSAEERQDVYRARHAEIQRRYEGLVEKFSKDVTSGVQQATRTLNDGEGSRFAHHLTAVLQVRDEKLAEILAVARRSGQPDLERAVAAVAYERGVRPVWSSWAESNPERAEAVKLIRGVPGGEKLHVRTNALRPPRADVPDLEPTVADVQQARQTADSADAARQAFFQARASLPRRQVGSRISH